jgi:hypothetical protein
LYDFSQQSVKKPTLQAATTRSGSKVWVKIWVSSQDFGVTVTPQTTTIKAAAMNAAGWPVARAVHFAKREKGDEE